MKAETAAIKNSERNLDVSMSGQKRLFKILVGLVLVLYSAMTIFPFYVLLVRTFVTTSDSNELHLWIPQAQEFNLDATFGSMAIFYDLDTDQFKKEMGIKGYVNPNSTFKQIAKKYKIPEEKIIKYMQPFYVYNGWYTVMKGMSFIKSLAGTIFITLASIILGALLAIATGSILAGFRRKWHFYAYNLYMLQIVIPPVMVMIPQFIITKSLGLYDSYLGLILFNIRGGALPTMLFTSHISSIPKEMKESVQIDGGNHFKYFIHVLLPLCKVPFASFMAIQLPWFWNDLLYPLLFLKPEKYTLTPWINTFIGGQFSTNFQAIYTGLFVSMIPILIVYLVFQKLFVQSAMAGAVKG